MERQDEELPNTSLCNPMFLQRFTISNIISRPIFPESPLDIHIKYKEILPLPLNQ